MNEKIQELLAVIFVGILLVGASDWAMNDIAQRAENETSQVLRESGINPMNGEWLPGHYRLGK